MFKVDVYFRNACIEVINYFKLEKKSINCFAGCGIHATVQTQKI